MSFSRSHHPRVLVPFAVAVALVGLTPVASDARPAPEAASPHAAHSFVDAAVTSVPPRHVASMGGHLCEDLSGE